MSFLSHTLVLFVLYWVARQTLCTKPVGSIWPRLFNMTVSTRKPVRPVEAILVYRPFSVGQHPNSEHISDELMGQPHLVEVAYICNAYEACSWLAITSLEVLDVPLVHAISF